ncbi:carboxylate--amine ligase [Geodermatophilus marinus]|uniref:carboxylate--amine ligase n=1 Tax=Geodermatophilus sp. LHW52908 TaxID=2303986 RepID=UPI0018F55BC9|nr:hypothetical protein [Geodermatophilus sp. LHW52908]
MRLEGRRVRLDRPAGPPAVVVGLDNFTGLQTARLLAERGVPVIGLVTDPRHYACRTRACVEVVQADLLGESFVDELVNLGRGLDERAVLFPCTDLTVLLVSQHRERLAPWFRMALPDHDVVETLMDKIGFLRHAKERRIPIPDTVIVEDRAGAERAARELAYPVVLKPPIKSATWQARTSRKVFLVRDARELLEVYERIAPWAEQLIAQEWIDGGAEALYSCNSYYDRASRPLVTFVARKLRQWPPHTGTSSLGEECRNDEVLDISYRVFGGIGYHGLAYVEVKRDVNTGRHVVIEPNVGRPTGRSAIAEGGGVALLYTAYCDMVGLPLPENREQRYIGAKWIDDIRDAQSAFVLMRRRELTPVDWIRSLRGARSHAVLSRSDPGPFFHDVLQSTRKAVIMGATAVRSRPGRRRVPDTDGSPAVAATAGRGTASPS